MFPSSTHKGQAVLGFPDVCKTPNTPAWSMPVPVPYPNIAAAGHTGGGATKTTKTGGGPQTLRVELDALHRKLMALGAGDEPGRWHGIVDAYVMKTAELYKSLASR